MPYNLPQRKSPRATWHDYNGGRYFVTFCTKNHDLYFGDVVDGRVELSEIGKWTAKQIEQTAIIRQNDVEIPLFVVMPNHVHLIVVFNRVVPCRDASNASASNVPIILNKTNESETRDGTLAPRQEDTRARRHPRDTGRDARRGMTTHPAHERGRFSHKNNTPHLYAVKMHE